MKKKPLQFLNFMLIGGKKLGLPKLRQKIRGFIKVKSPLK